MERILACAQRWIDGDTTNRSATGESSMATPPSATLLSTTIGSQGNASSTCWGQICATGDTFGAEKLHSSSSVAAVQIAIDSNVRRLWVWFPVIFSRTAV